MLFWPQETSLLALTPTPQGPGAAPEPQRHTNSSPTLPYTQSGAGEAAGNQPHRARSSSLAKEGSLQQRPDAEQPPQPPTAPHVKAPASS